MHQESPYFDPSYFRPDGNSNLLMLVMKTDEMAPAIPKGDDVFFNPAIKTVQSNGVYVLQIAKKIVVRTLLADMIPPNAAILGRVEWHGRTL